MPWARIDDRFHSHPKILSCSPGAVALYVCALTWSVGNLTDGSIPAHALGASLPGTKPSERNRWAAELVTVGLWERTDVGYAIHDYSEFQPTREEVERERQVKAEAGRFGGLRSGAVRRSKKEADASSTTEAGASSLVEANAKQNEAAGVEPPSHPIPEEHESPDGLSTRRPRPVPIGHPAMQAFFDETKRLGWEEAGRVMSGKVAGNIARAMKAKVPQNVIIEAARECARRRNFAAFSNILADVQAGAAPGRPSAPRADADDPARRERLEERIRERLEKGELA
jgi:hypothetical protein